MISKSLGDLIEEARPTIDSGQSCDYINGHIDLAASLDGSRTLRPQVHLSGNWLRI
jgi:hypothetical protein